jgi:hypothetical protein
MIGKLLVSHWQRPLRHTEHVLPRASSAYPYVAGQNIVVSKDFFKTKL